MLRLLSCAVVSAMLLAQTPQSGTTKQDAQTKTAPATQQTAQKPSKETNPPSSASDGKKEAGDGAGTKEKAVPLRSVGKVSQQRIAAFWIVLPGGKR